MYDGFLVYAGNGNFTDANKTNAQYGCGTYDVSSNAQWYKLSQDVGVESVILLVDRNPETSTCTFSEKVWNAQLANAKVIAVLVADTRPGTQWPIYMRGDSLARTVDLPSLFVPKVYGDVIRLAAQNFTLSSRAIKVELEFFVPNPDSRVEYDFFYKMLNTKTLQFLQSYGNVARVLKQRAYYTPHFFVEDATEQCLDGSWGNCVANCLFTSSASKYYCLYPTTERSGRLTGITGAQALNEMLRQQCIFNALSALPCPSTGCGTYNNYYAWTFWSYTDTFYSTCISDSLPASERMGADCSQNKALVSLNAALKSAGVTQPILWGDINSCATSWVTGSGSIPLLDTMIQTWQDMGPYIEPFLYVNLYPYSGDVSCKTPITEDTCGILSMMCYGYLNDTTYPVECTYPNNCPFGSPSCSQNIVTTTEKSGISAGAVVGIVLAFLFIAGVVGYYFHKKSQDRTKQEVDALLKQYLPMDPGQTHGVAQGAAKLREQHERRLIQDMDLEDQELETTDEV